MEKKIILVVEDFASVREFVCETLQKKGYNTIGAANGNEAYSLLADKKQEVNLVLADYYMPDCTGFELLKRIKANSETASIPVIFLTTGSSPEKIREAREAGLTAWIKKPYRAETFFAQIENAVSLQS
jgi:two-component system, chemotaxis family, chemotaxis protein CheY